MRVLGAVLALLAVAPGQSFVTPRTARGRGLAPLRAQNVAEVTAEEFERVIAEGKPTVVDVYAKWCGPCQLLEPELEKVADHFGEKLTFMKMDSDIQTDIASRLEVYALPTLLMYKDGELLTRLEGAFPAKVLQGELEKIFFA